MCPHGQDDPLFLLTVVFGDNCVIFSNSLTLKARSYFKLKAISSVRTCEIALNIFMTRREGVE